MAIQYLPPIQLWELDDLTMAVSHQKNVDF